MGKILKIGHRGAMGYCQGNTLASFEKAIELGADMVELDVHLFGKKIIVSHNAPKKGRKYLQLEDVIELINRKAKMNIELKGRGTAKPVAKLLRKHIKKGWSLNDFLISSFRVEELKDFKKTGLKIKLGFIVKDKDINTIEECVSNNFFSAVISFKIAKKNFIKELKKKGIKVFVWTVNKKRNIKKLMPLGVDGIVTDYPDRL